MRLTLRTLLAYLDGILEPNDAQDIGKKVEESEFATSLVHRIRDVVRRLRLGAPALTERDQKGNPNTVAEYLDNALPAEEVAEFERVCLESDIHLAEVASSHQILTLVLGEPAEIDPASRQRMYQLKDLPTDAAPASVPSPTASIEPPPVAAPPASAPPTVHVAVDQDATMHRPRPRPTVPEYLRDSYSRPRWLPTAVAVVLFVCFTMVVLQLVGQFEPNTPIGDLLVRWGLRTPPQNVALKSEPDTKLAVQPSVPPEIPANQVIDTEVPEASPATPATPAGTVIEEQPPAKESVTVPDTNTAATKPSDIASEATEPAVPPPADSLIAPAVDETTEKPKVTNLTPSPTESKTVHEKEKAGEAIAQPPEPLGRFVSTDQILLKEEPEIGWVRVPTNQVLMSNSLMALPTYRTKVTLTAGVAVEALGPSRFSLLPSSAEALPGVRVNYGRLVLAPPNKGAARVRVEFGDRSGVLAFSDPESVAAIEVWRVRMPGTDPEAEPSRYAASLYVTSGGIEWEETTSKAAAKPISLTSPQWLTFNGNLTSEPTTAKEVPKWIAAETLGYADQLASPAVAQALRQTDQLARVGLQEIGTSRPQKEIKKLTQRCLGCIGQYRDLVAVLDDPARRFEWSDYIEQLCDAVGRDAESAAAVRLALEKQYPQQANELYRMLWGYTDKDLQNGDDAKLVRFLSDNDSLPLRVLAIWNLQDLTGLRGQSYRPEQTAAKRQQPTQRWKQRLEAHEIRLKASDGKPASPTEEGAAPAVSSDPAGNDPEKASP